MNLAEISTRRDDYDRRVSRLPPGRDGGSFRVSNAGRLMAIDSARVELEAANDNLHPVHVAILQGLLDPATDAVRGMGLFLKVHEAAASEPSIGSVDFMWNGVPHSSRDPLQLTGQEVRAEQDRTLRRIHADLGRALYRDTAHVLLKRADIASVAPRHTPAKRRAEAGRMRLSAAGEIVAMRLDEEEFRRDRIIPLDILHVKMRWAALMPPLLKAANENVAGYDYGRARRHPP